MNVVSISTIPGWGLTLLFITGLVAGFVDSIAGGGGLITLPILLSLGLPPRLALGTNKLQATFGSGSAAWHYKRAGVVDLRRCRWGVVFTIAGATAGTFLVQELDARFLKHFIPAVLLAIAAYMFFKSQLGAEDIRPRMRAGTFYLVAGLGLGFYDGFIGPGTGTFWTMALMLGLGLNLTKATGETKVMNFASNVTSLVFFSCTGQVLVTAGLVMGAGQLLGAKAGSHMVVTKGTKFIRPVFLATVLIVTLKLAWNSYRK
jgi:hypothetical protein